MAFKLATLFCEITGDHTKLDSALTLVRGKLSAFSVALGTLGGNLATDAVHAALGGLRSVFGTFGELIDEGAQLEEAGAQVGEAFGAAGEKIARMADRSARAFGQARADYLVGAAEIGDAFKNIGIQSGEAADMTARMADMASDYAHRGGIPLAEAFRQVTQAIHGQNRALRRANIDLDPEAVKRRAMTVAMPAGLQRVAGPNDPTEAALKLARAEMMLEQFRRRAGSMGAGDQRYAGLALEAEGRIRNMKADLGLIVLGPYETAMRAINYLMAQGAPIFDQLRAKVASIADGIAGWVKYLALVGTDGDRVWELFRLKAFDAWGQIRQVGRNVFGDLFAFLGDLMGQLFNRLIAQAGNVAAAAAHEATLRFMATSTTAQKIGGVTYDQLLAELRLRYPAPGQVKVPGIRPDLGLLGDPMRGVGAGKNAGAIRALRDELDAALGRAGLGDIARRPRAGAGGEANPQVTPPTAAQHTDVAGFAKQLQEKISGTNYAQKTADATRTMQQDIARLTNKVLGMPNGVAGLIGVAAP